MPEAKLPWPELAGDRDKDFAALYTAFIQLRKELEWMLQHLDEDNVVRAASVTADWVYAGQLTAEQINAVGGLVLGENASIVWEGEARINLPTPEQIGAIVASQEAVFNQLTDNGALQGLFMEDGELYMNASYIKTGTISAEVGIVLGENAAIDWDTVGGGERLTHIDEDGIYTGTLTAEQINVIEGIVLGAGATVQWGSLENPPTAGDVGARADTWVPSYSQITGTKPPSNADRTSTVIADGLVTTGRIELQDSNNITKSGIAGGGSDTAIAIWSGSTYANRASAPFRVNYNGVATMVGATIQSAATGNARVVINSSGISGYNSDGHKHGIWQTPSDEYGDIYFYSGGVEPDGAWYLKFLDGGALDAWVEAKVKLTLAAGTDIELRPDTDDEGAVKVFGTLDLSATDNIIWGSNSPTAVFG